MWFLQIPSHLRIHFVHTVHSIHIDAHILFSIEMHCSSTNKWINNFWQLCKWIKWQTRTNTYTHTFAQLHANKYHSNACLTKPTKCVFEWNHNLCSQLKCYVIYDNSCVRTSSFCAHSNDMGNDFPPLIIEYENICHCNRYNLLLYMIQGKNRTLRTQREREWYIIQTFAYADSKV